MNSQPRFRHLIAGMAVAAAMASTPFSVRAQEIVVGVPIGPTTIDPHHFAFPANNEIAEHIYEALVGYTNRNAVEPELAVAWRVISDRVWEFDLRPSVRFHDGSAFTAADVSFSIERARASTGPSPMTQYVREIESTEVISDTQIRIVTKQPFPLLLDYLARVHIVPRHVGLASQADFDSGKAAVGTGPFRFVGYTPGSTTVLARWDGYWRTPAHPARVTFRVIPNTSAREAALLAGDVQIISAPGAGTIDRLRTHPNVEVIESNGFRIVYLGMQQARDTHPGITGAGDKNPFKDPKVREAVSLAIDRKGLVDRILRGAGTPAAQLLYEGAFGFVNDLQPAPVDAVRARALLGEAGFPNGFQASLAVASDAFPSSVEVANAVAALLSRIGIRVTVDSQPATVFRERASRGDFALYITDYGNPFPDGSAPLRAITGTRSRETGFGTQNFGGYANPSQNELLVQTFRMMDRDARRAALERAARITFGDHAVAPLYWTKVNVAKRRDIGQMQSRSDGIIFTYNLKRP
jgi:peptide/nickel transport system substrate-binding protein